MLEAFELVNKKEMSYVVTKELHEDGTPHRHIYLEFKKQMCVESRNRLHVKLINNGGEKIIQEGKYEVVRSSGAVIEYILKDANKDYITNMNLPTVNGVVYNSPEEHLLAILKAKGLEAAADILLKEYESLAARKGTSIMRNLQTLNKILVRQNNEKNVKVRNIEEFKIPELVSDWVTNLCDKKALVLYGPSGTGKTEFCKSLIKSMNRESVFVRTRHALLESEIRDNRIVLFDDVSLADLTKEKKVHYFDTENNSQMRVM